MMDYNSCKILLDAVYEPHWTHYQSEFGSCIAGFFSDEPELGNGHLYARGNPLGTDQDLPFSSELAEHLALRLGPDWADQMFLLWENKADPAITARVRYAYMDCVSALVGKNFSRQIGDWCHSHGVQYIGHCIEDCGTHARTASGLGHYFRGLSGQDMAGIDDIGGQVYPLGENDNIPDPIGGFRDATFYHFLLGKLGSSAAAIEPRKQGNTMCEIFGNYGWSEGVRLEKYLVDHFLVRGVNYFVPHAFSAKAFPDPDCPPHFYAHGHNPQFRHFSELMGYINRTSTLFSSGHHISRVALLYHAEGEWSGAYMKSDLPARALTERQIDFDLLPCDVFRYPEYFKTRLGSILTVNTQEYKALIIPYMQFIPPALCSAICELLHCGMPVFFLDQLPQGDCENRGLPAELRSCPVIPLEALVQQLDLLNLPELSFSPDRKSVV